MVEIKYGGQHEIADLAGQTISEVREQFRSELGIPDKAKAKLNGSKVKGSAEFDTVLNDDDKVTFGVARNKGAYMLSALLLALAITGGVFAYGFINATTTLTASVADANFADVSVNANYANITWSTYGYFKGSATGVPDGVFDIDTDSSGYTGDLVITVALGNADALSKYYRVLALKLDLIHQGDNATIDINEDNTASAATDWVLLTLNNGSVDMFPDGSSANMTVRVKQGFFITHVRPFGGWSAAGDPSPDLFCEVAQR
jgi:molybdopterin converting factor small subunit